MKINISETTKKIVVSIVALSLVIGFLLGFNWYWERSFQAKIGIATFLVAALVFLFYILKIRATWLVVLMLSSLIVIYWNGRLVLRPEIGVLDWQKEIYFFHYFRSNLVEFGQFPINFVLVPSSISWYPTLHKTFSYWANPETLTFSPLLILLPFLSTLQFIKVYFFSYMVIGISGIYLISKRLGINAGGSFVMICLTVLNPWLIQHLAIGYTPWIHACSIPMIIAMLLGSRIRIGELIVASCLNALIIYGGGLHIFVWFNGTVAIFYFIFSLCRRQVQDLPKVLLFFAMSGVLIFPKILAILTVFGNFPREIVGGYQSLMALWGILTDAKTPLFDSPLSHKYGVALYDGSTFMGVWFIVLVFCSIAFSIYRFVKSNKQIHHRPKFSSVEFFVLSLLFIILGWEGVWKKIVELLPLLGSEVYPYRFIFIAICLLSAFVVWESHTFTEIAFKPKYRNIFILLLFLPTMIALYNRNQMFIDAAITNTDRYSDFDFKNAFDKNGISNLNQIKIEPTSDGLALLGWLEPKNLNDYELQNAEIVHRTAAEEGTLLRFIDKSLPAVLSPRDYYRTQLLILAIFGYLTIVFFIWRYQKGHR